ncbi:uncharacterized protein [Hyperolius riggenbachi]|uniref:uncharacterized protein isoform X2 n=1 Tax=Hyperolius riggenbachi TaxID=752182 RepID=UPI0035A38906
MMASSKTAGTWADLQESLNRVRKQYGLLPRAGWDDLITMASYERSLSGKLRNRNQPGPILPSLTDEVSRPKHRTRSKQHSSPVLHKNNDMKKNPECDAFYRRKMLLKNLDRETTKPNLEDGLYRYFIEKQHFAWEFVESLVAEIMLDEILPDVVIEALTNNPSKCIEEPTKKYYGKESTKLPWMSERLRTSYSELLLDDLLTELLKELSSHVLKSEVDNFVTEHLVKSTCRDLMDDLLTDIIRTELPSMIEELHKETELDRTLESLIQNVTDMAVKDIVTSALSEYDEQFSEMQKNQIVVGASKHIVDMFLLEQLVGLMGRHRPLMFEKDSSGCLLDSITLDILLKEYVAIQQASQMTLENFPVRHFHQNTFTKVALEVILTDLSSMLTEKMEDILEYEQDIELG